MLSHPWIDKENYLVDSVCIGCIGRRNAMTSSLKMSYADVILCGNECYFYNKTFGIEMYARPSWRNSLVMPNGDSGRNILSAPHAHVRFL